MEKRRKARRVHRNVYRILFLLFFFLNVRLSCLPFSKSITDREVNKTDLSVSLLQTSILLVDVIDLGSDI